jgi:hypothetical protein
MKWIRPVIYGVIVAALLDIPIYFYFRTHRRESVTKSGAESPSGDQSVPALLPASSAQDLLIPTPDNLRIDKIRLAGTRSPEFKFDRTPQKRAEYKIWFEIEVEFSVILPDESKVLDEITFEYLVEINGNLCSGEVTHVNLAGGNHHYSIIYLSPRNIDRLTDRGLPKAEDIGNAWVTMTRKGIPLVGKSWKAGASPNGPRLKGWLIPKAETPFRDLWWDRYDEVKAAAR